MKIAFQEQEDSRDISLVGSAEEVGKIAILICLLSGKVGAYLNCCGLAPSLKNPSHSPGEDKKGCLLSLLSPENTLPKHGLKEGARPNVGEEEL